DGQTWRKLPGATAPDRIKMSFACRVMRLAVDPARADEVYATLEVGGVIRSLDGGETWDDCTSGLLEMADRPHLKSRIQSDSRSDGQTWRKLPGATAPDRIKMSFACRVMRLAVDPARADEVYATLEVGGVIRSLDGGETWDDCTSGLLEMADRPHLKSRIQSDSDAEGM